MTEQERQILFSLASTMEMTRAELDTIRTLFTGTLAALASNPEIIPVLTASLNSAINADAAISLSSPMTDQMLQKRSDWLDRLIPAQLRQSVRLS